MPCRSRVALQVAGLLAVLAAGCSRRPGDQASPGEGEPGTAAEALAGVYCISEVQTDPCTYHFDSPRWLLEASEGVGPRLIGITIAGLAEPLVSTTVSRRPSASDVSLAVGYSLGEYYFVQASAAQSVDSGKFQRLEAYIDYARSTWVVREAGCGAVLGTGMSLKPIGVYFAIRDSQSVALDGENVIGAFPACTGGQCGYAPDPPPPPPPADAGAGDAGRG